jgi:preprotein translocase subunit SecF
MEILSKRAERRKKLKKVEQKSETILDKPDSNRVGDFFERNYKKLMILPILLLVLSIGQIAFQVATTGDFVQKGISLSGGTSITIQKEIGFPVEELEASLIEAFPLAETKIRSLTTAGINSGAIVESTITSEADRTIALNIIKEKIPDLTDRDYTQEVIGASLGEQFFKQTLTILLIAFVLMSLVVFFYFREIGPSMVVISSMISDLIITLAIINVLGIKLSTAGIAAFLMLIGYSVDTDIVLSTKMLKEKGTRSENFISATRTALTMTITTLCAVSVTYFLTSSEVIKQIMVIIFIGLLVDMIVTWLQNGGLIRIYLDRKNAKA